MAVASFAVMEKNGASKAAGSSSRKWPPRALSFLSQFAHNQDSLKDNGHTVFWSRVSALWNDCTLSRDAGHSLDTFFPLWISSHSDALSFTPPGSLKAKPTTAIGSMVTCVQLYQLLK
jgi:hypothetical protein